MVSREPGLYGSSQSQKLSSEAGSEAEPEEQQKISREKQEGEKSGNGRKPQDNSKKRSSFLPAARSGTPARVTVTVPTAKSQKGSHRCRPSSGPGSQSRLSLAAARMFENVEDAVQRRVGEREEALSSSGPKPGGTWSCWAAAGVCVIVPSVVSVCCLPDPCLTPAADPLSQQGSLNFHFFKSKNRVRRRWTGSAKPQNLTS